MKSKAKSVGGAESHLGSQVTALALVRRGYRQLALETYTGTRLTPASLFVKINMEAARE